MEASSDTGQKLTAFISQLLSGVVESVCQQGYQVAFLASKCGDGSDDILSLHGGLSLNIQKQLEVNFRNLIREAAQDEDCSICQSPEETMQSNHPVSIPITDVLAAVSSLDDHTSNTITVMESAAYVDNIEVEYTAKFDASLTSDPEYSQTTDNDTGVAEEYNNGETLEDGTKQPLHIKTELPHDLQIEDICKKKCKYCKYKTKYKSKLMRHMMSHTGKKPFSCTECPYRTTDRATLKKHNMSHTGEKPFACPQCPYRSTNQSHLKTHYMTHTGEKPFACPQCPYRSTNGSHLKRHILTHMPTGEKPFTCPECPHRSRRQSHMKQHILTHRPKGEKPFACPECPYRSIEQRSLKMHMLKHSEEKL